MAVDRSFARSLLITFNGLGENKEDFVRDVFARSIDGSGEVYTCCLRYFDPERFT